MLRRITAITSALLAAGALTAATAAGAGAATSFRTPAASEAHLTAHFDYSCGGVWFENSYGGGNGQWLYARATSPYQLLANTAKTTFCTVADGKDFLLPQNGLNRCLNVESNHQVDEATCNAGSNSQIINFIQNNSYGGGYAEGEVQFVKDTADCIYQDGRDSAVEVKACNPNQTGDEWITNW